MLFGASLGAIVIDSVRIVNRPRMCKNVMVVEYTAHLRGTPKPEEVVDITVQCSDRANSKVPQRGAKRIRSV